MGSVETNFKEYFYSKINIIKNKGIKCNIKSGDSSLEYNSSNLLVLPSVHDSFGLVVPEALISGLPVLVSSNAGSYELINHQNKGEGFLAGDMQDFCKKIDKIYQNKNFYKNNSKNLSNESMSLDWNCIYKSFNKKLSNELL